MRVTVPHNKTKAEVMRTVDRSFDDLFRGSAAIPLKVVNERRNWEGSILHFSFDAKLGVLGAPIRGFLEVTDKDLTIDADLGFLERLLPAQQARNTLETNIRGLLR